MKQDKLMTKAKAGRLNIEYDWASAHYIVVHDLHYKSIRNTLDHDRYLGKITSSYEILFT